VTHKKFKFLLLKHQGKLSCDDFKCFASQARNCKQKRRNFRPKIEHISSARKNLSHQDKKIFVSYKEDEQKQATKHGLLNLKA